MIDELSLFVETVGFWLLIPGAFLTVSLVSLVLAVVSSVRNSVYYTNRESIIKTVKSDSPMIAYKTANLASITLDDIGEISDIVFKGLTGAEYRVKDSTRQEGWRKFNMYSRVDDALEHEQNWGSTFLEVIASGDLEEYKLGYTAQRQRVLQVAFIECSQMYTEEVKCRNEPDYLARDKVSEDEDYGDSAKSGYKTYCAGCVKRMSDVRLLAPYYNRSFKLADGNTVVVTRQSSRECINFVPTVNSAQNLLEGDSQDRLGVS